MQNRKSSKAPTSKATSPASEIVYGRRPVLELLRHASSRIEEVLVLPTASFQGDLQQKFEAWRSSGGRSRDVSLRDLEAVCGQATHQGIIALVKPAAELQLDELVLNLEGRYRTVVVCDQITDPQNLGSVFRAAAAAGVGGIVLTIDHSAPLTPVVRKASAGATELIPYARVKNLQRALKELKELGFWIVGTAATPEAKSLYETEIPDSRVIVLGSEGHGIRQVTIKECDLLISIPMSGVLESLNVSQAASVVLFELQRRIGEPAS